MKFVAHFERKEKILDQNSLKSKLRDEVTSVGGFFFPTEESKDREKANVDIDVDVIAAQAASVAFSSIDTTTRNSEANSEADR